MWVQFRTIHHRISGLSVISDFLNHCCICRSIRCYIFRKLDAFFPVIQLLPKTLHFNLPNLLHSQLPLAMVYLRNNGSFCRCKFSRDKVLFNGISKFLYADFEVMESLLRQAKPVKGG